MTSFIFDKEKASHKVATCWNVCKGCTLSVGFFLLCVVGVAIILSPFAVIPCATSNTNASMQDQGTLAFSVPVAFSLTLLIVVCLRLCYRSVYKSDNFKIWSARYRFFEKTFYYLALAVPILAYAGLITVSVCVCTSTLSNETAAVSQFLIVLGEFVACVLLLTAMQLFDCLKPSLKPDLKQNEEVHV